MVNGLGEMVVEFYKKLVFGLLTDRRLLIFFMRQFQQQKADVVCGYAVE